MQELPAALPAGVTAASKNRFDGIRTSEFPVPSLSTISVNLNQLAQLTVAQIMRQINNPDNNWYPTVTTVGYQLIERESTR